MDRECESVVGLPRQIDRQPYQHSLGFREKTIAALNIWFRSQHKMKKTQDSVGGRSIIHTRVALQCANIRGNKHAMHIMHTYNAAKMTREMRMTPITADAMMSAFSSPLSDIVTPPASAPQPPPPCKVDEDVQANRLINRGDSETSSK